MFVRFAITKLQIEITNKCYSLQDHPAISDLICLHILKWDHCKNQTFDIVKNAAAGL